MDQQDIFDNDKRKVADEKDRVFKRTIILSIAFLLVNIVIFSAQTFAFFTDSVTQGQNVIEAGELGVEIIKLTEPGDKEVADTESLVVMPTMTVSKIIKIQNTGNLPTYARVKLDVTIYDDENNIIELDWQEYISFIGGDESAWKLMDDGYYYYTKPLQKESTTEALFRSVKFSEKMGNEYEDTTIVLTVTVEATQVNGNGTDVFTATGWPVADED